MPRRAPWLHLTHPEAHIPLYQPPVVPSQPLARRGILILFLATLAGAFLQSGLEHYARGAAAPNVALPWLTPFVLLLASIAFMPFIARHFWEKNYPWFAFALSLLVAGYYTFYLRAPRALAANLSEYISFIYLLGALYIVSGGILLRVRRTATPTVNTALLLAGALLANVLGTTGASMLLIRPYLHMNQRHVRPFHIVFFIFIVSNLGGVLTPIGDPPLFLGYLQGVPFWWVAQHCWPAWAVGIGLLLAIFYIFDTRAHRQATRTNPHADDLGPALTIFGAANLLWLALILLAVFLPSPWREALMVLAACASLRTTAPRIHTDNVFNFAPIREVAILFLGLFATMVPALHYLQNHAAALARLLPAPGHYYFACGALSSTLDNAPTYFLFFQINQARLDANLVALSLGAVFFGACTYLGNGPNFMVKSIATHAGLPTPSFFAYIFKYTLPILLPVLILVWLLFLH